VSAVVVEIQPYKMLEKLEMLPLPFTFIYYQSDVYCQITSLQSLCFCCNSIARCCWLAARSLWTFHLVVSVCCGCIPSRARNFARLICSSERCSAPSGIQPCTEECRTISSCVHWSVVWLHCSGRLLL